MKHEISRADLMGMDEYGAIRREHGRKVADIKKRRRMPIGPDAQLYFESYDTMWHQIHEMLFVEKGGEAQIPDELGAYNPLVPKGRELVATFMIEIPDADRRAQVLAALGGIEETVALTFDGETVKGIAETDVDRTNAAGKASSVQFLHFPFSAAQISAFRQPGARVVVEITHPNYAHMAVMSEEIRATLAQDFD